MATILQRALRFAVVIDACFQVGSDTRCHLQRLAWVYSCAGVSHITVCILQLLANNAGVLAVSLQCLGLKL